MFILVFGFAFLIVVSFCGGFGCSSRVLLVGFAFGFFLFVVGFLGWGGLVWCVLRDLGIIAVCGF